MHLLSITNLDNYSDLVRAEIRQDGSKYGKIFQEFVKQGKLIPDELVNALALDTIKASSKNLILDGYPRNIPQAVLLDLELADRFQVSAVHLQLDRSVTTEKLLGRMVCKTCRDEFNSANIMNNGYCMPALLPDPLKCKLGQEKCHPIMEKRDDDTAETIQKRFIEFDEQTAPLMDYYTKRNALINFHVKKGVEDAPDLAKLLLEGKD
jgi:adenylate kinase